MGTNGRLEESKKPGKAYSGNSPKHSPKWFVIQGLLGQSWYHAIEAARIQMHRFTSPPPPPFFFCFLDFYPHEISTSHTEKVSQFGAGKSSVLATNSEWANSFQKPNDVMCIRASNTFSYVKKSDMCAEVL